MAGERGRGGNRRGRYVKRIAQRICENIALGDTIQQAINKEPLGPSMRQFFVWVEEHPEFMAMYERAKIIRADLAMEEHYDLSRRVLTTPKDAPAYKVASDILRGHAELINPEKYGKKLELTGRKPPQSPAAIRAEIKRLEKDLNVQEKQVIDVTPHQMVITPPDES